MHTFYCMCDKSRLAALQSTTGILPVLRAIATSYAVATDTTVATVTTVASN